MNDVLAPRERGWKLTVLALAAFLLIPLVPHLRAVLPVENTLLLLLPAISACMLVGWWAGGPLTLTLVWIVLALWVLKQADTRGMSAYLDAARAWGLLVAGSFGIVCVVLRGGSKKEAGFFHRSLSAIGLAVLIAGILMLVARVPLDRARSVFAEQFALRNDQSAASIHQIVSRVPSAEVWTANNITLLQRASELAEFLYPALLALEGLIACALAWSVYHRLSRARIGPALRPLRDFRFSDQLIWGLVVGLVIVVVPTLAPLRWVGWNLLVFFGLLYVLRGLGVIAWHLSRLSRAYTVLGIIWALIFLPVVAAASFALGVNDTWFDLRGGDRGIKKPPSDRTSRSP